MPKDDSKSKESFRRVRITSSSFVELAKILEGFNALEYDAWYDEKLRCVVCELHIPKSK
mgnify:CR=1 FL=1